jgi:4-hydroxyphenylpyruvate dioxygenase
MLCISTGSVSGNLTQKLEAIADAGFQGFELCISDVVGSAVQISKTCDALGLEIIALSMSQVATDFDAISKHLMLAVELGAPVLIVDVTDQMIDLPEFDALQGVKLALRPSLSSEKDIVKWVHDRDHPCLGLVLNSAHILSDGSRPARLRDVMGRHIFHIQLADGTNGDLVPGLGTLNLQGFLRVIVRSGYTGPLCVSGVANGSNDAHNAYRALLNLLDEVSKTEPHANFGTPRLAPRVPATGIEFIEFCVDDKSAQNLTRLLSTMAFRKERSHVSKDVSLWRQGAVNIVINQQTDGHAGQLFKDHGPMVCDMGLRVQNADETVARANALGTLTVSQDVGLGELKIPAICGVGGSLVHFIDEQSDLHRVWDIEFEPAKRTQATPPAGLRRIDHIAQTMQFDEMQDWLLYYISTFEMEKSAVVNVHDPSGVVLSQAIESPEGDVRLNLNGAHGHDSIAGSFVADKLGAGVQHLAFATDDIFETSAVLETNGFSRLSVPASYYAEIQERFDLDPDFIADLKTHNILYDEDTTGAYLQLYSETLFDGFFFEIVERRNGYAGYGARNAPVRLSAQTDLKHLNERAPR